MAAGRATLPVWVAGQIRERIAAAVGDRTASLADARARAHSVEALGPRAAIGIDSAACSGFAAVANPVFAAKIVAAIGIGIAGVAPRRARGADTGLALAPVTANPELNLNLNRRVYSDQINITR
jgi:hypothetical protein